MPLIVLILLTFFLPRPAAAACTNPTGEEKQVKKIGIDVRYCDGTNWISMLGYRASRTCTAGESGKLKPYGNDMQFCDGTEWLSTWGGQTDGACAGGDVDRTRWDATNKWLEWCNNSTWKVLKPPTCPTGYVLVPAMLPYATQPFCLAKYEMKNVSGTPTSQAALAPWVSVSLDDLWGGVGGAACWSLAATLGDGAGVISALQWQTVARNIELVASNWSSGTVGTGAINRGHTDGTPNNALAADASDTNACSGTGQTCSNTVWHLQRRTHVLSNGQAIWDLAGNVDEVLDTWEKSDLGTNRYVSLLTNASNPTLNTHRRTAKEEFGTSGDYTSLNSGEYGGLGYSYHNSTAETYFRGGWWATSPANHAGIFLMWKGFYTDKGTWGGFRCSGPLVPPICQGKSIGQACDGKNSKLAGYFLGTAYMTTPSGCTDSGTPTCAGGTDTTSKAYGAYGTTVGATSPEEGVPNTTVLVTNGTTAAAKYCDDLDYDGYTDWHLPSRIELKRVLYDNRAAIGGFNTSGVYYWSSTESHSGTNAHRIRFSDGYLYSDGNGKNTSHLIRCIRRI